MGLFILNNYGSCGENRALGLLIQLTSLLIILCENFPLLIMADQGQP